MNFSELLHQAQSGDKNALEKLTYMYRPMVNKLSFIGEDFNEDLYQEQFMCLIRCIKNFSENF